ncbi:HTH-type transcriptional regulator / antitoxin HigA [Actinomadura meyerae]|uniref:HTH-type transcriptional regulator / antitoxin HigA n=1 Tax=Actinomadura meyerae TaxID=240840 RepID=A0A239P2L2_9ACTN|nr:ImmA/IrrE family metallo-endopeptidase [Actinomadura meyerae]SNT61222.1 HTH-type transcriptional regulator / antitoxin HigA [Actinomadura meyerae]
MPEQELHEPAEPDYAVPPGETIREFLDDLGMSQRQLSARLGLTPKHVNQLIQGLVPLTPVVALRLQLVTGMPARLWNRLEADYQTTRTRLRGRSDLDELIAWVRDEIPVSELVKRGVLPPVPKDPASRVEQVLSFFGVAHLASYRELYADPAVRFRQTKAFAAKPGAVAAWLRLGELQARDVACEPYDRHRLDQDLRALRQLTVQPPEVFFKLTVDICARNGIALVVVPEIPGTRAAGATKWLSPQKAMVMLSGRYRTDDQLWFTFFHELCHVMKHSKRAVWIEADDGGADPCEAEADTFARDLLIPPDAARRLPDLKKLDDIRRFAMEVGIAPGIVVGRMQREGLLSYRNGNRLKRSIHLPEP